MKLHIVYFVISLVLQIHASFIDDFRHAVRHVEHGFEKMLSDVVTDMEHTIHCTVAAMEHILIINGILDKLSEYNKKCPDDYSEATVKEAQHGTRIKSSENVVRDANKKVTSQELHSSIQSVNRTLNNILSRRTKNDMKASISDSLRNETNRLSEVSAILRRELEKIFSNVRGELDKIDFEQKSPEAIVQDEIQLLQKAEKDGNASEVDEIRHVVDDAVKVLKSDENYSEGRSDSEIDKIVKELENTKTDSYQDYKASRDREFEKHNNDYLSSLEENIFTKTEKSDLKQRTKNHELEPSNYVSSMFGSFGKSNEKETIHEVMDMVKESQVVNMLFRDDQPGTDLFGNPHLFNF